jgi:hypothetical protein
VRERKTEKSHVGFKTTRDLGGRFLDADMYSDFDDRLRTDAVPLQDATLTVRIIKSFEYRTEKSLVLQHIDLTSTSVAHLKELAREGTTTPSLFPASKQ